MINPIETLQKRVKKTSDARFNASRRFGYHQQLSLWSISLISIGQIIIPLLQAYQFQLNFNDKFLGFIQIVLAVVVLAYSLILSTNNYSDKQQKMHSCALELNNLYRKIAPHISNQADDKIYLDHVQEYDDILRRYDNHDNIDYMFMRIAHPSDYKVSFFVKIWTYIRFWLGYSHYVLLTIAEFVLIYYMIS